jgi:hypothetical protein
MIRSSKPLFVSMSCPTAALVASLLAVLVSGCDKSDGGSATPGGGGSDGVMCTADAKVCPDGSAVGRQGPNCEFAPCPEVAPAPAGCTKEAKVCPDGSSVGRQGPDCEFAPCPETTGAAEGG